MGRMPRLVLATALLLPSLPASASGPDGVASVAALATRLRNHPPPLSDPAGMARWFAPFGTVRREKEASPCTSTVSVDVPRTTGLLGMNAVQELCTAVPPGRRSRLFASARPSDDGAAGRAAKAVAAALGSPLAACSDETRTVWTLHRGNTTLVLLPQLPQVVPFTVLVVDGPASLLDGCRPPP